MQTDTLNKKIEFPLDPRDYDYDALVNADIIPANKKQIIIDHINANGIPSHGPDLALFQNNGVVIKDDFASYLGNAEFYSTGSFAKLANGTPLDWLYDTTDGLKAEIEKYKDRSHFDLGTFVHEAILEPEKWDTVVCEPKANRASHEGLNILIEFWGHHTEYQKGDWDTGMKLDAKKELVTWMIEKSGLRPIEFKDALIVQRLHERWKAYQNGLWAGILNAAHKEVSIYCNDYMGLPMRVRPDGLLFADQIGVNAIVSVKTTAATTIRQYMRDFIKFGYSTKEAAYQKVVSKVTGVEFDTTIMVVASTSEPYHFGVFILSDNDIKIANMRFSAAIVAAKECLAINSFPGWEMYAEPGELGLIDLDLNTL